MKLSQTLLFISSLGSLAFIASSHLTSTYTSSATSLSANKSHSFSLLTPKTRHELHEIQNAIEHHVGSRVFWNDEHEYCRAGLVGEYLPSHEIMVNSVENHQGDEAELIMTAKHEGWHAVQHQCNDSRAALRDDQILPHLYAPVRETLRHSYHPTDQRAEAEARVVEQIPTPNYIKGIAAYCAHLST